MFFDPYAPSSPKEIAEIISVANIQPYETVLELGSGSGELVRALADYAHHVTGIEIDIELVEKSREALKNISNVTIDHGDYLKADWKAYDVIIANVFQGITEVQKYFTESASTARLIIPPWLPKTSPPPANNNISIATCQPKLLIYTTIRGTGEIKTPEVLIPSYAKNGYLLSMFAAPASPLNIFDLGFEFELYDKSSWRTVAGLSIKRTLEDANKEIYEWQSRRVEGWGGKRSRAVIKCGQTGLFVSLTAHW